MPPHAFLPHALWKSSVQQSAVEELESSDPAKGHHYWQQFSWHSGAVCHTYPPARFRD